MSPLTTRQTEVAYHLVDGETRTEIASLLDATEETIKTHAKNIYKALGVKNVNQLTREYGDQFLIKNREPFTGYWLSRFEFTSRTLSSTGEPHSLGAQVNIEHIRVKSEGIFTHRGVSLCSSPSTSLTFDHDLHFRKEQQVVTGVWRNSNTVNMGCMQLVIHNSNLSMQGMHLGTTSDHRVSSGKWIWRKIHTSPKDLVRRRDPNFKKIEELEKFFGEEADPRQKIQLEELFTGGRRQG